MALTHIGIGVGDSVQDMAMWNDSDVLKRIGLIVKTSIYIVQPKRSPFAKTIV